MVTFDGAVPVSVLLASLAPHLGHWTGLSDLGIHADEHLQHFTRVIITIITRLSL